MPKRVFIGFVDGKIFFFAMWSMGKKTGFFERKILVLMIVISRRDLVIKNETKDKEIIDMIGLKIEGFMLGSSVNMRLLQGGQQIISYLILERSKRIFIG